MLQCLKNINRGKVLVLFECWVIVKNSSPQPTVGRLSVVCRPTDNRQSADRFWLMCRPSVGRLSVSCRWLTFTFFPSFLQIPHARLIINLTESYILSSCGSHCLKLASMLPKAARVFTRVQHFIFSCHIGKVT